MNVWFFLQRHQRAIHQTGVIGTKWCRSKLVHTLSPKIRWCSKDCPVDQQLDNAFSDSFASSLAFAEDKMEVVNFVGCSRAEHRVKENWYPRETHVSLDAPQVELYS